jgi:cysteinyl-tRNA synthetase
MSAPVIRLHDSRTRQKLALRTPAAGAPITLYVCGPTVYNRAHIGNARPAVVFDVLARLIRHVHGPGALVYARNITDIDDKIMAAARDEGVGVDVIAARYERHYVEDMAALGVLPPDIAPRATDHVAHMIAMTRRLIERGVAYEAQGHVLFSVAADPDYGSLSGRDRAAMLAGARVEVAPFKHDPADFVLWKPSAPDQPGWESPWGRGRPGWHIECSAMIAAHLGTTIDVHGGGQDLLFPHHENEAAQSRGAHGGAELARIWMHNGFLSMGAEKMSKSLGNVALVSDLLAQGWDGEVLRLSLLSAHWRQPLEWTGALLDECRARLDRLHRAAGEAAPGAPAPAFLDALADDLNTPAALAVLDGLRDDPAALRGSAQLIGLLGRTAADWFRAGADDAPLIDVAGRIEARRAAKAARDWARADAIRAELLAAGIVLEDRPDGTTDWRRAWERT